MKTTSRLINNLTLSSVISLSLNTYPNIPKSKKIDLNNKGCNCPCYLPLY